ncbi:MAG: CGNR zinc finger domain-containing protein [Chloroflexota bacterium]
MDEQTSFEHVGGHSLLDWINSEIIVKGKRFDLLENNYELWLKWWIGVGQLDEALAAQLISLWRERSETTAVFQKALQFRQAMRQMVVDIVGNQPISKTAVQQINDLLAKNKGHFQLTQLEGELNLDFQTNLGQEDPNYWLGKLAQLAADFLTQTDFSRLKKCQNDSCIRFYLDTSRNRSRRWCSMESCGNRMKVAAYYDRQKNRFKL